MENNNFVPFSTAKAEFEKTLPEIHSKLSAFIEQRTNALAKNIDELSVQDLTKVEIELSSSLIKLGNLQAEAETKASFIQNQLDSKWKELIAKAKEEDAKVSIKTMEADFDHQYLNEKINFSFWKGLAKDYSNQFNAVRSILLAITHKLKRAEVDRQPKASIAEPSVAEPPAETKTEANFS